MADSYVCSGATLRCPYGERTVKLKVFPSRTVTLTNPPMANISDHQSMVNIPSFGRCKNRRYPPTASATARHHGHLTPMPCKPGTFKPWENGKGDYLIKGQPALLKTSICRCIYGGVISTISITDDGQNDTGAADLQRKEAEDFVREQEEKEKEGLDADSVLEGIQLTLDAAGFFPGLGAIPDLANAAISALRGNWDDAGLSVLAAIPAVGDAAAAAKLAKRGLKAAKKAKAAKIGAEAIDKGSDASKAGTKMMDNGADAAKSATKTMGKGADGTKSGMKTGDRMARGGAEKLEDVADKKQQLLKMSEKKEPSLHGSEPYKDDGINVDYNKPNIFSNGADKSVGKDVSNNVPTPQKPDVKKIDGNSQKALDDTKRALDEDARSRPFDHKHKFDNII